MFLRMDVKLNLAVFRTGRGSALRPGTLLLSDIALSNDKLHAADYPAFQPHLYAVRMNGGALVLFLHNLHPIPGLDVRSFSTVHFPDTPILIFYSCQEIVLLFPIEDGNVFDVEIIDYH